MSAKAEAARTRLLGTWFLHNYEARAEECYEDVVYPAGGWPQGMLVYATDGYVSVHILEPGQKDFSLDLMKGTEAQAADQARRYLGYCGM